MTHDMPGTHQTRRRARSMTNSTRVQFGISFMLTLSPDEKHNAIFLRCARLRASDTYVRSNPDMAKWFQRLEPSLVDWEEEASPPPYEVRRRILTNSAISCVDGFKIHSTLLFKFLFGLKICLRCPFCNCCDAEGRSNEVEGGVLGRMPSFTGTAEFQKKRRTYPHAVLHRLSAHDLHPGRDRRPSGKNFGVC